VKKGKIWECPKCNGDLYVHNSFIVSKNDPKIEVICDVCGFSTIVDLKKLLDAGDKE
jgi:transcription elongation factor Elf1